MITAIGSDNSSAAPTVLIPKVAVTTDTKGRLRVSKAQRRDILAALAHSGESLPRFAQRTGLKYSTLANFVLAQLLDWIHPQQFQRCVTRYDGDYKVASSPAGISFFGWLLPYSPIANAQGAAGFDDLRQGRHRL